MISPCHWGEFRALPVTDQASAASFCSFVSYLADPGLGRDQHARCKIKVMQRHSHHRLRGCTVQRPERSLGKGKYSTWEEWTIMLSFILSHAFVFWRGRRAEKWITSHFHPTKDVSFPWTDHDFSLRGIHPETTGAM